MRLPRWTHSLKWRIVASYSLILILGGVSTSIIGIRVTSHALLEQARQQVAHGLSATRTIYDNRLREIQQCVELLATSGRVRGALDGTTDPAARHYLASVQARARLDFLAVADARGQVRSRATSDSVDGDVADLAPVAVALTGTSVAATELIPLAALRAEDPALIERVAATSAPAVADADQHQTGMVLVAAAPVTNERGEVVGVVYGGELLNVPQRTGTGDGNYLVDQMRQTLYPDVRPHGRPAGIASIFQNDVCITTNVLNAFGARAIGTRVTPAVRHAVIDEGRGLSDRTKITADWYITAYEPITDLAGQRIGILGVGVLQRPYTQVRDNVTLAFAGIALFCFVLIVVVTYFLTRSLMRPLEEMVVVSRLISDGDTSHRVRVSDESELGVLADSFNAMLDRINEMTNERYSLLEQQAQQWTQALEQKVQERTEQLAKTQAALDRQQRLASLGQLAAGVAHEINNPLGGILTFASLVLEELPSDSPARADMNEIVAQTDRCRRIVKELLEFSRQRSARTAARDVNGIISRTLALLEKQASFQNIEVVRELDHDLPDAIIDESQMQQVFMNLFINAADAMNERGRLTVQTGRTSEEDYIFIRITDTGCGIPKNHLEAIFDPFFTTKDPGKGTGLGLAVCCRIVQAHGGRLEVESQDGQGTTFTIVLPTGQAPDAPPAEGCPRP